MPTFARSIHYDRLLNLFNKLYYWKYTDNEAKKRIKGYVKTILSYKVDYEKNMLIYLNKLFIRSLK